MYYTLCLIVLYLSFDAVLSDVGFVVNGLKDLKNYFNIGGDESLIEWEVYKNFDYWSTHRYKMTAHADNGEECIDNCINGTCITDSQYDKRKPCKVTTGRTPPVYFTTRERTQKTSVCLSRCGKIGGSNYEWCFIDDKFNWDYCSSQIHTSKLKVHLADDGFRCATPCSLFYYDYVCINVYNETSNCKPDITADFIQARTKFGVPCASACYKETPKRNSLIKSFISTRFSDFHYECYDIYKTKSTCAPPALRFESDMKKMYRQFHTLYEANEFRYEDPYPFKL